MNMQKRDFLWLAIRLVGIFFLAKSLIALPVIPGNIMVLNSASCDMQIGDKEISMTNAVKEIATANLVTATAEFLFFGLVGLYLCRKGRWLHSFIKLPEDHADSGSE